jgi:hypothetical protein
MSDTTNNAAEKPVNDGGGSAPQPQPEPTDESVSTDSSATQESGSD